MDKENATLNLNWVKVVEYLVAFFFDDPSLNLD